MSNERSAKTRVRRAITVAILPVVALAAVAGACATEEDADAWTTRVIEGADGYRYHCITLNTSEFGIELECERTEGSS